MSPSFIETDAVLIATNVFRDLVSRHLDPTNLCPHRKIRHPELASLYKNENNPCTVENDPCKLETILFRIEMEVVPIETQSAPGPGAPTSSTRSPTSRTRHSVPEVKSCSVEVREAFFEAPARAFAARLHSQIVITLKPERVLSKAGVTPVGDTDQRSE